MTDLIAPLVLLAALPPLVAVALLGLALFVLRRPRERLTSRLTVGAQAISLAAHVALVIVHAAQGGTPRVFSFGRWFTVADSSFEVALLVDWLALVFGTLTALVAGVVSAFAHRYMHRERGYHRLFLLLNAFVGGLLLVVYAATLEVTFAGWELLGVGSALLVGFFHEREAPVRNALRVFVVYRIGDAAMMAAAILLHHELGSGAYEALLGGMVGAGSGTTVVGVLLVVAAAGKCAQLPFSGWLPRAMEGPTPSTAIFYGALSVHAGAYLMLRVAPLLASSPVAAALLGVVGVATAIYAAVVGRVQTDIKSALAYASLTQVSIILVEIALGLTWLAVAHVVGHSLLRVLQFLRAPSVVRDAHRIERALGGRPAVDQAPLGGLLGEVGAARLYALALDRGHVDEWLDAWVVRPFLGVMRALDRLERRWCDAIAGGVGPAAEPRPPAPWLSEPPEAPRAEAGSNG